MRFLDANIFLRYLTRDDAGKAAACEALFERLAHGEETATTSEAILHEVLYVLTSKRHYQLSQGDAAERLRPLLTVRGLRLKHKQRYLRALTIYGTHPQFDFPDALAIVHSQAEGSSEIVSYDSDFDDYPTVTRSEP